MLDIIGIGDAGVDLMVKVDHIPGRDEKVRGNLVSRDAGGIVSNFCCAAARFGARTGIITTVGEDDFGRISIDSLKEHGVDTRGVVVKSGEETYFCIVHLDESGEKALTVVETPLLTPGIQDLNPDYIGQGKYVHLSSLDFALANHVSQLAKLKDIKFSIDIEPTANGEFADWVQVLKNTYIAFFNEAGIKKMLATENYQQKMDALLALGPEIIVVTCGARGAEIFTKSEYFAISGFAVPVLDTTGAGDCFNAVFLATLVRGWDLKKIARYASAAAALSIQQVGARTGLPTLDEVENFLIDKQYEND